VVNLQGDEPQMPPALVRQVAEGLEAHPTAGIATVCTRIRESPEVFDPNVVKVVRDRAGLCAVFQPGADPLAPRGVSGEPGAIDRLPTDDRLVPPYRSLRLPGGGVAPLSPTDIGAGEQTESLEQLRALWQGIRIHVAEAAEAPPPGVDTEADLARVAAEWDRLRPVGRARPVPANRD
jgi:3-deoxy-manno-octulosonate cytidylyltransferase (CMP-KDO synthetase)